MTQKKRPSLKETDNSSHNTIHARSLNTTMSSSQKSIYWSFLKTTTIHLLRLSPNYYNNRYQDRVRTWHLTVFKEDNLTVTKDDLPMIFKDDLLHVLWVHQDSNINMINTIIRKNDNAIWIIVREHDVVTRRCIGIPMV